MSSFNSNPIVVSASMASGWRGLQTLNTGNVPTNLQQTSGAVTRQWGIRVTKVVWANPGASGAFSIVDPNDNTVLLQGDTSAGYAGSDVVYENMFTLHWRDFKATLTAGTLYIWYRA
jgi:hypothetical protein